MILKEIRMEEQNDEIFEYYGEHNCREGVLDRSRWKQIALAQRVATL